jgi:hypothetical protein
MAATPAVLVGIVEAPDEETAIKKTIEEYEINNPEQQKPLVAGLSHAATS